jgi:hypothetical protein
VEGLFRISGSSASIELLKKEYDRGLNLQFTVRKNISSGTLDPLSKAQGLSVHEVSGLLKKFLRELPEPLFLFDYYYSLVSSQKDSRRIAILREVLTRIRRGFGTRKSQGKTERNR